MLYEVITVPGQHGLVLVHDALAVGALDVASGQHAEDAGQGLGGGDVHPPDAAMRDSGPFGPGPEHPLRVVVDGEALGPERLLQGVVARLAAADQGT